MTVPSTNRRLGTTTGTVVVPSLVFVLGTVVVPSLVFVLGNVVIPSLVFLQTRG
jgi:hypothetical protein